MGWLVPWVRWSWTFGSGEFSNNNNPCENMKHLDSGPDVLYSLL